MKKLFSLFMVLMAICTSSWAGQPVLTLSGEVSKGGEGFITLSIACDGEEIRDLQVDIILPKGFAFSENENGSTKVRYHEEIQSADYTAALNNDDIATYTASPRRRLLFNTTTGALMKDGPILDIFIKEVSSTVEIGETATALATGSCESTGDPQITFSLQHSVTKHQEDTEFTIEVWGAILDEENKTKNSIATAETGGVLVKRTIKAGKWNTICLPFAMDNDQVIAVFGDDVEIADFKGIKYENGDKDISVKFSRVTPSAIEANHPYIFKPGSKISEDIKRFIVMETVNISPAKYPEVFFGDDGFLGNFYVTNYEGDRQDNHLYLSDNKFYYLERGAELELKGFRGILESPKIKAYVTNNQSANVNFFVDDETIDGIDGVTTSNKVVEGVYDLQGRKVNDEHLKRGVYIIDGKKVVVK